MTLSYQAILKALTRVIIKNSGQDPITMAERCTDALETLIEASDEGDGIPPLSIAREPAQEPRRTTPAPPPASTGKSPIILPTDKEFKDAVKEHGRGGLVLSKVGQPSDRRQAKLWSYETMVDALMQGTPEEFYFQPDGTPDGTRVLAKRNILTLQGTDTVRLMYANPQMGDDSIQPGDNFSGGKCAISLQATVTFTLFDESLDIPVAMAHIMEQCRGLYRARNKTMSPDSGPEPGPLRMEGSPMGATEDSHMQKDWQIIEPRSILDGIVGANRQLGNR